MIGGIKIGDLGKERARMSCQRVKSKIVNGDEEELGSRRRSVRRSSVQLRMYEGEVCVLSKGNVHRPRQMHKAEWQV